MNIRIILLLVLAVSAAGSSAFMAKNWLANERAEILASVPKATIFKEEKVEILVVKEDLLPGSFLLKEKLTWQEWPEDALNDRMLKKGDVEKEDFVGYVIRSRIPAGQPLVPSALVRSGEQGFLAAVLAPGMRAITVPISATSGVAGFVFPGDKVDLLHTIVQKPVGENAFLGRKMTFTQTLLKNVRILAKDQSAVQSEGEASVSKSATIEVTPKQAEAVSLALSVGKLSLSLRSLVEEKNVFPNFANIPDPKLQHDVSLMGQQASAPDFVLENKPEGPFRRLEIKDDMSLTTDMEVNFFTQKLIRLAPKNSSKKRVQVQRGNQSTLKEFK